MPCPHKFQEDLQLERLDFEPLTLIVGTFNPSWPDDNPAEWFYGRTRNNYLWDVLPRLHDAQLNLRSAAPAGWKQFCHAHRVALTDIISAITDADEQNPAHREILRTYLDATIAQHFGTFGFTDLEAILADHPTIRSVYLTRQPGIPLFDERWATVIRFAEQHPERGLHIRTLLTPSGYARYQIGDFKRANPGLKQPLRHFIHHSWSQQWRRD